MPERNVKLLFALSALSGFTGLIYESVWSHYLKLFLGAAAFAQSFVLAAFMGGMALGAWLASRWSARLKNLLAAYGWIEAAIGVAALIFHESFLLLTQFSLDRVLPALGSPAAVEVYKYSLCAVLIVPQTLLLGMTFPLLSGAVIRRGPEASGDHLAMLYCTNWIGAAAGALAAAFLLLGWLGMPGTMRFAGALNLALAAAPCGSSREPWRSRACSRTARQIRCARASRRRSPSPLPTSRRRSGALSGSSISGSSARPARPESAKGSRCTGRSRRATHMRCSRAPAPCSRDRPREGANGAATCSAPPCSARTPAASMRKGGGCGKPTAARSPRAGRVLRTWCISPTCNELEAGGLRLLWP